MEVIKKEKTKLQLSFKPFDQGLLNAINEKNWTDSDVQISGFQVTHPEVGEAIFTLKTKKKDAKTIWNASIAALTKDLIELKKQNK
jgi:DNA-directed RNA polymerase subunit L